MPELPEVEALAAFLRENAVGHVVTRVDLAAVQAIKTFDPPLSALGGLELTGVSRHGDNAKEFRLMVEAGMPPLEAIKVATSVPARFLDLDDRTGSIAVGKLGELVGVPGDPLTDISVMERVVFVMKDNTVHKAP